MTARTRCGLVKFRECGQLLYGRRFPLRLKGTVYMGYVRPAILYGSKTWCLKVKFDGILRRTERSMVRAMCGVQVNDRKRSTDLMFMLGLNVAMDQMVMANSVRWSGHVLRREDGHVLRRALDLEFVGQMKKGRLKRTWKKQIEEESVKVGLIREDALCRSKWSVGVIQIAAGLR